MSSNPSRNGELNAVTRTIGSPFRRFTRQDLHHGTVPAASMQVCPAAERTPGRLRSSIWVRGPDVQGRGPIAPAAAMVSGEEQDHAAPPALLSSVLIKRCAQFLNQPL